MPKIRGAIARLNALMPRPNVKTGAGCWVDPSAKFLGGAIELGDKVTIFRGAEILGPVSIGSETFLNRDAYVRPNVTIGKKVDIGAFCKFITDDHEPGTPERRAGKPIKKAITIGDGAWIGAAVTVIGGVNIGPGATIGAGAVVVSDVPAHETWAGVPAKRISKNT